MKNKEKVNNWLQFAEEDLAIAKILLQDERRSANIVYHLQQCVEKNLKGYLEAKYQNIENIHSLVMLLKLCSILDNDFNSLTNLVADFSNGNHCRYPNSDATCSADAKTITEWIQITEFVKKFVIDKIS